MSNKVNLQNGSINRLLIKYSVPAIISMMVTAFYNTIDRIFIGQMKGVGAYAISGLGITMPLFTIIGAFAVGLAVGGTTNITLKLGQGNKKEAEEILGTTVALEAIIGLAITIFGIFFINKILYAFGASDKTIQYARDYMFIILLGCVFNLPGYALNTAIRGEGNPKLSAKIMIVSCLLNVVLDPLLIFVLGIGIKGAAIGTVISQLLVFVWGMHYFTVGKKSGLKLKLKNIRLRTKTIMIILSIAISPFAMELAAGSIHVVINYVLKIYGGDLAIGAMTVITSISLMFFMPIFGLSQGMQTIIAYNYGAKQYKRSIQALVRGTIVSVVVLAIGSTLVFFMPGMFVGLFTDNKELLDIAIKGIKVNIVTLPFAGVAIVGPVYFQSIGQGKKSMILTLLRQVIFLIPIIFIMAKLYGLKGIWVSQPIADIIAMTVVAILLIKEIKKVNINK